MAAVFRWFEWGVCSVNGLIERRFLRNYFGFCPVNSRRRQSGLGDLYTTVKHFSQREKGIT